MHLQGMISFFAYPLVFCYILLYTFVHVHTLFDYLQQYLCHHLMWINIFIKVWPHVSRVRGLIAPIGDIIMQFPPLWHV
jgi:hypothetical protein